MPEPQPKITWRPHSLSCLLGAEGAVDLPSAGDSTEKPAQLPEESDQAVQPGPAFSTSSGSHLSTCPSQVPKVQLAVCQNLVPLVNIKIAGKWMFIPLKMVLNGINRYWSIPNWRLWSKCHFWWAHFNPGPFHRALAMISTSTVGRLSAGPSTFWRSSSASLLSMTSWWGGSVDGFKWVHSNPKRDRMCQK